MSVERIVIADDLSGAAEIAGIAQRLGWRTQLSTHIDAPPPRCSGVPVWVIDTDSRDIPASDAAQRCASIAFTLLRHLPGVPVFKKVDSVLRGHVAAECEALLRTLALHDVLLLPANPSRGRCIRRGRYEIDGVSLSQTAFAHDPHYPADTDEVHALLRVSSSLSGRFGIPDVTTSEDLKAIVAQTDPQTLVAGAADAFTALCPPAPFPPPPVARTPAQTLILNGSAASQHETRSHLLRAGAIILEAEEATAEHLLDALRADRTVHATLGPHQQQKLRALTAAFLNRPNLHLALTGGATARAFCDLLQLDPFEVLGEWAPGVVRLRPQARPDWEISIKPGSYVWPDSFLRHVA